MIKNIKKITRGIYNLSSFNTKTDFVLAMYLMYHPQVTMELIPNTAAIALNNVFPVISEAPSNKNLIIKSLI